MHLKSPTAKPIHVALLSGDAISVGPEGRDVPALFVRGALVEGCVPAHLAADEIDTPAAKPTEASQQDLLFAGFRKLQENPQPGDMTGAGLPNRNVLSKIVGWNVSVAELGAAWQAFNDAG